MYPEGHRVLVVDRETERGQTTARILKEEGFAVTAVSDAFSAIRAAAERRFSLAVITPRLPGSLDGPTTVRLLRSRKPALRALYVGAVAERPARLDPERDGFIPYPYQPRELLGCVFELLQRDGGTRRGRGIGG